MMRVEVATNDLRPYEIIFINQIKRSAGSLVCDWLSMHSKCTQVVFITDDHIANVQRDYIEAMVDIISSREGVCITEITVPAGEQSKSLATCEQLWEKLSEVGFSRTDLLIAFGGGVIGDLVGFCAATYLRGVSFIQIPTTLLSQIDSSVGGKVAINLPLGKNLVGQFYNPEMVMIDSTLLRTLAPNVLRDGLGELIKYAFMGDSLLLAWLEQQDDISAVQNMIIDTPATLEQVIHRCLEIKKAVVEKDFKEHCERKWLNLGHTFGHAIEAAESYRLGHGYCVVLGLYVAGEIGWRLLTEKQVEDVAEASPLFERQAEGYRCFKRLLTTYMARFDYNWELTIDWKDLLPFLMQDKKRRAAEIQMVLPRFEQWAAYVTMPDSGEMATTLIENLSAHLEIISVSLAQIEQEMMRFEL